MVKNDVLKKLTTDLGSLAEKFQTLKNRLDPSLLNGTQYLLDDIDSALERTMVDFNVQEYEIERNLEKWLMVKHDLDLARLVQRTIYPKENVYLQDLHLAGYTRAAKTLGGDYYNYQIAQDYIYGAIGDVAGKGIANALLTIIIDNHLRQNTRNGMPLEQILMGLNQLFSSIITEFPSLEKKFMTFLLFRYRDSQLEYAGAGQEYLLFYRAKTGHVERIKTGGVALGLITDFLGTYSTGVLDFEPGDFLVTYSDGITEARNEMNQMYRLDRLVQQIEASRDLEPHQIIDHVIADVDSYQGQHEQYDDITLLVLKRPRT